MTKLNVLSKGTLFICLFSSSLSSMAGQTSFGIEEQLSPDLRQNKRLSIDRKEVNVLPSEKKQSLSSSYLSSLGHIASFTLDGLTKAVFKGYGVYTVVALPIVTALETNLQANAPSAAIMTMSEIDILTKENCLIHFYDSKHCDELLGNPESQYSSIVARYPFLPQISYIEMEAKTENILQTDRRIKNKTKNNKKRKSHTFFRTKGLWPSDLLVGVESEFKIFPKGFEKEIELCKNKKYGRRPLLSLEKHLIADPEITKSILKGDSVYGNESKEDTIEVRSCIEDNSPILLSFDNRYPRILGYDIVLSPETKDHAYEFRTIDGLKRKELINSIKDFQNWVLPIYESFQKESLIEHHDPVKFNSFAYTDQKSKKPYDLILINNKSYAPEYPKNPQLVISNQATFSCNISSLASIINKIMLHSSMFFGSGVNYETQKPLYIFKSPYVPDTKEDSWAESSSHYFFQKVKETKVNLETLNSKQQLLIYYILTAFKHSDQFERLDNLEKFKSSDDFKYLEKTDQDKYLERAPKHKSFYSNRVENTHAIGNNYLKAFFTFLPKIPEHLWLTKDDLEHDAIKLLRSRDLSIPYEVGTPYSNTKGRITADNYLEFLAGVLDGTKECDKKDWILNCYRLTSGYSEVWIETKNNDNTYTANLSTQDLLPSSLFLFNDNRIIVEVRALKNTILKKNSKDLPSNVMNNSYMQIFENFFNALEEDHNNFEPLEIE